MIKSFKCSHTKLFYETGKSKYWTDMLKVIDRKLQMLDKAVHLRDLTSPPNNKLEELIGDRKGTYSIRINDQYRLCFLWTDEGVYDVEIVDYH